MLWKLALGGIKSRLKDYIVLFSGLTISAAIFYMFQSLASNPEFLKANSTLGMIVFIFYFGSVLLGIITLVYILYANSFLLTMRQRTYAMFMMLGAKSSKIAQLIFIETVAVGVISTVVGSAVGVGLTSIISQVLVKQMDISITHFSPWSTSAALVTAIFFLVLFAFAAIYNAGKLVKTPVLNLLNQAKTPTRFKRNPVLWGIEVAGGLILLAVGYWSMAQLNTLQLFGLGIALVTIVLGSYFVFDAFFLMIIQLLRRNERFRTKELHSFTLGQLSFRIRDFTRLLSMVSIVFALALGAITVGLGFHDTIQTMAEQISPYDLMLHDPTTASQKQADALSPISVSTYQYKVAGKNVYFLASDFNRAPFKENQPQQRADGSYGVKKVTYGEAEMLKDPTGHTQTLADLVTQKAPYQTITVVNAADYAKVNGTVHSTQLYITKDFMAIKDKLKPLVAADQKQEGSTNANMSMNQKYSVYALYNTMMSGFEFMGLFLGIAFLAMLASCLMFKILSGAASDALRYQMLEKIGTRRSLLKKSIRQEIGTLFVLPGILGVIHVLFGLQMFKVTELLPQPYHNIWLPFLIFLVLYVLYYFLTVQLYSGIVLHSGKQEEFQRGE
ncbi:FtsX-like permease family protein [Schleiferilactobacillus perolens]|jgi:putative ABC transport system permease protein|uniref:FtsX-like permease family protein n=1 Tax=Schleiferilactobacillus perolens TaxID=100468 RepID=UPI002355227C|nr:FtsX-like permease family protein [Schleiferilactobacillus perolens]MCI1891893.1 FtsX-like permease family protein [Schleiferilactobacillus harbinensis]MCI1914033.1 FtsX-like permease family protein [Schleiferilactobacillus harbinensis]MCI2170313.1 FtsX-like permease family protein [Schleiferilactobacillus perolens]